MINIAFSWSYDVKKHLEADTERYYTVKHAYNKVFGRAILLRYQHSLLNPSSLQYNNKVTGNENHIAISVNSL